VAKEITQFSREVIRLKKDQMMTETDIVTTETDVEMMIEELTDIMIREKLEVVRGVHAEDTRLIDLIDLERIDQ
jgi:hypothetical protein